MLGRDCCKIILCQPLFSIQLPGRSQKCIPILQVCVIFINSRFLYTIVTLKRKGRELIERSS